jgi:hypothetical protein
MVAPVWAKVNLREAVAQWFPEVAREGLPPGEYLRFTASADGEVIGHQRLRHAPAGEQVADGGAIAVSGFEELAAMRSFDRKRVRSIDRTGQPAGAVAPTPVTIVWVQMRAAEERGDTFRVSSTNPPRPRVQSQDGERTTGFGTADGRQATATERGSRSPGSPDPAQLRDAMQRFFTPELVAAGVSGKVDVSYTVGPDGRAHDIEVRSETPALIPVGRSIVESLTFSRGPLATPTTLHAVFGVRPRPGSGR